MCAVARCAWIDEAERLDKKQLKIYQEAEDRVGYSFVRAACKTAMNNAELWRKAGLPAEASAKAGEETSDA